MHTIYCRLSGALGVATVELKADNADDALHYMWANDLEYCPDGYDGNAIEDRVTIPASESKEDF